MPDPPDPRTLPPWSLRPVDDLPAAVGLEGLLAASDRAVVSVSIPWAYPTGFEYMLCIRLREPQAHGTPERGPFFEPVGWDRETGRPHYRRPEEEFQFAVTFADGRTPAERHVFEAPSPDDPRPAGGIAEVPQRGGGNAQSRHQVVWVWPLPPSGPLTFTCDWPAMGIHRAVLEFDAARVLEAAARAAQLTGSAPPLRVGHKPPGISLLDARSGRPPVEAGPPRKPPPDLTPGLVPVERLLGRSASAAVAAAGFEAYPTGFTFTLLVRSRQSPRFHRERPRFTQPGDELPARDPHRRVVGWRPWPLAEWDDSGLLELGVAFADGRSATAVDDGATGPGGPSDRPPIRLSHPFGGMWSNASGGAYRWWVEPLPPPGPVTFACRWLGQGIDETRVEIDGDLLRSAAQRATRRRGPDWTPKP